MSAADSDETSAAGPETGSDSAPDETAVPNGGADSADPTKSDAPTAPTDSPTPSPEPVTAVPFRARVLAIANQ